MKVHVEKQFLIKKGGKVNVYTMVYGYWFRKYF